MLMQGEYFFLSNFFPCDVSLKINNKVYVFKDVEAAFQAQKNASLAEKFLLMSGKQAKQLGKNIKITTENWDKYRLYAMAIALHSKFANTYLLFKLKAIKEEIVEDNFWNDRYWGKCKGEGKNMLGKLLMNIRDNNNDYDSLMKYVTELQLEDL